MFPIGHVAYTWGAVNIIQRRVPQWADVDYRWLTVAAILPDIVDKPLAMTVFKESQTSQGLTHTLLAHIIVAVIALAIWRWKSLPYLLAFSGHLLFDQIWRHPETVFWPFMGWEFDPYRFMGTPEAMISVYWKIFLLPQIWVAEGIGLIILAIFFFRYRLYRWANLRHLLSTGRLSGAVGQVSIPAAPVAAMEESRPTRHFDRGLPNPQPSGRRESQPSGESKGQRKAEDVT